MGIVKDNLYRIANKKLLTFFKGQTVFPYYHIVGDTPVKHIENLYPYKNVSRFKSDISLLLEIYKPLPPKALWAEKPSENAFLLSFDDGLAEVYTTIFPILKQQNIKALFFINPDFVDNRQSLYKHDISLIIGHLKATGFRAEEVAEMCSLLAIDFSTNADLALKLKNTPFVQRHLIKAVLKTMNIDMQNYLDRQKPYITKVQIQEMIDDGHYFGGHTMSHPPLKQLTHEQQKAEIIDSIEWLKSNFGIQYSIFAFPFSDRGVSRKLLNELFEYDKDLRLFGNSGMRQDIDERIIQRFSLENPNRITEKQIVTEHLYKIFNKATGQYKIKRK
jgi:peptidoglycan/xylan/chitin deacetylase (PgdA/CDA1 family)